MLDDMMKLRLWEVIEELSDRGVMWPELLTEVKECWVEAKERAVEAAQREVGR